LGLRFILGRAGTGKTFQCLKEIYQQLDAAPEGPPLVFIVPEQATLQTERALLNFDCKLQENGEQVPGKDESAGRSLQHHESGRASLANQPAKSESAGRGLWRVQVLSFRRLAWRVLQETGGFTRPHIAETGKQMLLRKIMLTHRKQFRAFGSVAGQPGFPRALCNIISELKNYRIEERQLWQTALSLNRKDSTALPGKLHDLAFLSAEMGKLLAGRYIDPDDYLSLLAGKIASSNFLRAARIWMDGFSGFTPQEYQVIEQLLPAAAQVNVAFCLDGRFLNGPGEEFPDIFSSTRESYLNLKEMANRTSTPLLPTLFLDGQKPPRFRKNAGLRYLEQNFFRPAPGVYAEATEGIKVAAAVNPTAEVEGAAREIISLCREKGWHWREISVVLRDVARYETLLRAVFTNYKIPFFIDSPKEAKHHPLGELIRSALEAVAGNWPPGPLFRYLKTDLVPVTREEADLLENYVLAHGIKGSRWYDDHDWQYTRHYTLETDEENQVEAAGLDLINQIKMRAREHLCKFQNNLRQANNLQNMTGFLYELLISLDIPKKLEDWSKTALEKGELVEAREHRQIWKAVVDLFDQLVEALGGEKLSLADFTQVVKTGLEGIRLGLIPPGLDQVLVGSLPRSRNPDVRACFVLGANEGALPARPGAEEIFTAEEREQLESSGIKLAPAGRQRICHEHYLVYIALTRSSEYLWLSYPLADEEGKAYAPSPVIEKMKKVFPGLQKTTCLAQPPGSLEQDLEFITNPGQTLAYLVLTLQEAKNGRDIPPLWWAAYNRLLGEGKYRRVLSSLFYTNQEKPLSKATTAALHGKVLKSSISQCERYHACKFAYNLAYCLKLKERSIYKLQPPELGVFYHACLKALAEKLSREKIDWEELDKEQVSRVTGEIMEEIAPRLKNEIFLSSARHRFLAGRAGRTLQQTVGILAEHARQGAFKPEMFEVAFAPGGHFPPLLLPLPGGLQMELSGRIDRVDIATLENKKYLRVIDYKSGLAGLNLNELFYGLKLQLIAYLHVAQTMMPGVLPGGIFYFPVAEPLITTKGPLKPAEAEERIIRELRMKGYVLADPRVVRLMDEKVAQSSRLIPAGLKNDGTLRVDASALDLEQFACLTRYLQEILRRTGEEIFSGQTQINPYRLKRTSACNCCPYRSVCLFDPLLPENNYRLLTELAGDQIWTKIIAVIEKRSEKG